MTLSFRDKEGRKLFLKLSVMADVCNPSYSGGGDGEDGGLRPA
jgi:hypothetical protein